MLKGWGEMGEEKPFAARRDSAERKWGSGQGGPRLWPRPWAGAQRMTLGDRSGEGHCPHPKVPPEACRPWGRVWGLPGALTRDLSQETPGVPATGTFTGLI